MMKTGSSVFWRYSVAVATVVIALGLKLLLVPMITQDAPFLLFFGAVLISAWSGGLGPGLLATVLACLLSDYFFMRPFYDFTLPGTSEWLKLGLFTCEGAFISILGARMQAAKRRADENARRARSLEQRMVRISDEEQQRIGRDLHDGLGQHLTGIALLSRRLAQLLEGWHLPEAAEAKKIERLVNDAVKQTRSMAAGLSAFAVETSGLSAALRDFASQTQEVFGICCSCTGDAPVQNEWTANHLYRIAQEAVHNAVRHSKASQIDISLEMADDLLTLAVRDNGTGLAEGAARGSGQGLQTMQERADMIGATLKISRGPAGGTMVTCAWPVTAETNTED